MTPLPWSLEQCVALTRTLHSLCPLRTAPPHLFTQHACHASQLMIRLLAVLNMYSTVAEMQRLTQQLSFCSIIFIWVFCVPTLERPVTTKCEAGSLPLLQRGDLASTDCLLLYYGSKTLSNKACRPLPMGCSAWQSDRTLCWEMLTS